MDPSSLPFLGLTFVGLLVLSAFFSGTETAFFSLSESILRALRERGDPRAKRVIRLLDRPRELLITILIGNTLVNAAAASIAAVVVDHLARQAGFDPTVAILLDIIAVTFILIVLVEISPKVFAYKNNEKWSLFFSGPTRLIYFLFFPLTKVMDAFVNGLSKVLGVEAQRVLFNEEELRTLAEIGEEHGALEEEEREMIHSIFEFGEKEVHEVMIPRMDMTTISADATVREAIELVKAKGHSRLPVFEGDVDHIIGILFAKDLIGKKDEETEIRSLVREAYFVPEGKLISSLLKEFQQDNRHIAIVVDEYGGTEGLVTLEDVIEEIVGEIHDEYDKEETLFRRLDNGELIVDAKIEVEVFNENIGEELVPEGEDYETLGGFIFSLAGEVPDTGQGYTYRGWVFHVTAVEANRVVRLRIQPPEDVVIRMREELEEDAKKTGRD